MKDFNKTYDAVNAVYEEGLAAIEAKAESEKHKAFEDFKQFVINEVKGWSFNDLLNFVKEQDDKSLDILRVGFVANCFAITHLDSDPLGAMQAAILSRSMVSIIKKYGI